MSSFKKQALKVKAKAVLKGLRNTDIARALDYTPEHVGAVLRGYYELGDTLKKIEGYIDDYQEEDEFSLLSI